MNLPILYAVIALFCFNIILCQGGSEAFKFATTRSRFNMSSLSRRVQSTPIFKGLDSLSFGAVQGKKENKNSISVGSLKDLVENAARRHKNFSSPNEPFRKKGNALKSFINRFKPAMSSLHGLRYTKQLDLPDTQDGSRIVTFHFCSEPHKSLCKRKSEPLKSGPSRKETALENTTQKIFAYKEMPDEKSTAKPMTFELSSNLSATCLNEPGKVVCEAGRFKFIIKNGNQRLTKPALEKFLQLMHKRVAYGDKSFTVSVEDAPLRAITYSWALPPEEKEIEVPEPLAIECTRVKFKQPCNHRRCGGAHEIMYKCRQQTVNAKRFASFGKHSEEDKGHKLTKGQVDNDLNNIKTNRHVQQLQHKI